MTQEETETIERDMVFPMADYAHREADVIDLTMATLLGTEQLRL